MRYPFQTDVKTALIRGVLKTFGLLPGTGRGLRFDRMVEALLEGVPEIGLVVRPLLATWRQLREQIAVFDKAVQDRSRRIRFAVC